MGITSEHPDRASWFSRMSLRTKFSVFASIVFACLIFLGGFVFMWLGEIQRSVDQIIEEAKPRSVAAYEMEINVYESITAILKYLRAPTVDRVTRFESDVADFHTFLDQYNVSARSGSERVIAESIGRQFAEFTELGREIIVAKDEETLEIARLSQLARTIVNLSDTIEAGSGDQTEIVTVAGRLREVKSSMSNVDAILEMIRASASGFHSSTLTQSVAVAATNIEQLRSLRALPSQEESMAELLRNFAEFNALFGRFLSHHEIADERLHRLATLRESLDHVLDEEIQSRTTADIARARDLINMVLSTTRTTAMSLALACSIILILAVVALSRGVVKPIEKIARAAQAFADGDLDQSFDSNRHDEVGLLGRILADTGRRIADAQRELTSTNAELSKTNDDLANELEAKKVIVQSLREAVEQAQAADRAKAAFLTNMSHEFRTPLNAIMGLADTMSMELYGPLGDVRYQTFARDIHRSGEHLLKLFTDVVRASELEAQPQMFYQERLDGGTFVRQAVSFHEKQAHQKKISLSCTILPGSPPVEVDRASIQRAISNLVENAINFSPERSEVQLLTWYDDVDQLVIQISNEGDGMSPEEISASLGMFGTINPLQADQHRGLGLGISVSKRLIEMNGGSLSIDSVLGEGTKVKVFLPCFQRVGVDQNSMLESYTLRDCGVEAATE